MSERGSQLLQTAERQISELLAPISAAADGVLGRPCPGREKLGDGSIAAVASHVADTYLRIAGFASGGQSPRLAEASRHDTGYRADPVDRPRLLKRLADARTALGVLAELTDEQLGRVPPAGEARFCDGSRTTEQVLSSMLGHQRHQIDALLAAMA